MASENEIIKSDEIERIIYDHYQSILKATLKTEYESVIRSLEAVNLLRPQNFPIGSEYSITGVLMRGLLEPIIVREVDLNRRKLSNWCGKVFGSIALDLRMHGPSDAASKLQLLFRSESHANQLSEIIQIGWNTDEFKRRIELATNFRLPKTIDARFPNEFILIMRNIAVKSLKDAVAEAGKTVSNLYREKHEAYFSKESIFLRNQATLLDDVGAVKFHIDNNRLSFERSTPSSKTVPYRQLLQNSISRIINQGILTRIDNTDRMLSSYINEYIESFESEWVDERILILTSIVSLISGQIEANQTKSPEERIDKELLLPLENFIANHSLFAQGYSLIDQAMRDSDRASNFYKRIPANARVIPWNALRSLTSHEQIFDEGSKKALNKLDEAIQSGKDDPNQIIVVLGIGSLRGSLRSLAGVVLEESDKNPVKMTNSSHKIVKFVAKEIGKESVKQLIQHSFNGNQLVDQAVRFFLTKSSELITLSSTLPGYFEWITAFVKFVQNCFQL